MENVRNFVAAPSSSSIYQTRREGAVLLCIAVGLLFEFTLESIVVIGIAVLRWLSHIQNFIALRTTERNAAPGLARCLKNYGHKIK